MAQQHIFMRSLVAVALTVSSAVGVIHLPPVIANPAKPTNTPIISQPILTLSGHTEPIRAITISPDGQILASSGDDKTIKLWNLKTGKLLFTLTGHLDGVNSIAISPDGQIVVSCSYDI
jgi:WD40 repeat protein